LWVDLASEPKNAGATNCQVYS